MATYYVKLAADGGNDSLAGTSPSTAWATLQKALGASGIASGDTLYIAPGTYIESVVIGGTYSASTFIIGDPTATFFPGITAAPVRYSNLNAAQTAVSISAILLSGTGKSNLKFSNIHWYGGQLSNNGYHLVSLLTGENNSFDKCVFESTGNFNRTLVCTPPTSAALNLSVTNCIFMGGGSNPSVDLTGSNVADTTIIRNCLIYRMSWFCSMTSLQAKVTNCTSSTPEGNFLVLFSGSLSFPTTVNNCLIMNSLRFCFNTGTTGMLLENYNRVLGGAVNSNVTQGANSIYAGGSGIESGYALLHGLNYPQVFGSSISSPNASFGIATNASATDLYGVTWTGANPDSGSATYRVINSTPSNIAYNGGNERNASAITIAPASTSQSIELYLGATGLTFSTTGLAAYYVRNQSAPVAITLVTQTPTGAWTSGGFAEISSSLVPGVYRLDVPNAAFAAGASDVTIVVRGAYGTNGAVLTVTLSSGGLTAAQTASAVWGESVAGYTSAAEFGGVVNETRDLVGNIPDQVWGESTSNQTSHGSFGWNVLRADQQSKEGKVTLHSSGGINRIDADIHAIVNDADAAAELKGALLHTGGDYITANLLTPVTGATSVHIGPYQLLADGLGASDALDIQQSTVQDIAVRCIDANGSSVSLSGATVTAKVYNSAGTLVATYAGTITYAADGWLTFGLTTAVTNTVGTYTITITRTTSATDTSIYGPLRMYVRGI
jgi:hypothetical protein